MTENRTDLLTAVQALTRPQVEHFTQKDDDGGLVKIHSIEHACLLDELAAAVNPSTNKSAGSASMASTRNLIDSDALFEWSKMSAAIGGWCRIVGVTPTRNRVHDLDAWYVRFTAIPHLDDNDIEWYRIELRRWANLIRNMLEPPKRFELTTPCPVCKSDTWVNPDGETVRHPILVQYRVSPEGAPVKPSARCRNEDCDAEWDSIEAIEELGEELQERHTGTAA